MSSVILSGRFVRGKLTLTTDGALLQCDLGDWDSLGLSPSVPVEAHSGESAGLRLVVRSVLRYPCGESLAWVWLSKAG